MTVTINTTGGVTVTGAASPIINEQGASVSQTVTVSPITEVVTDAAITAGDSTVAPSTNFDSSLIGQYVVVDPFSTDAELCAIDGIGAVSPYGGGNFANAHSTGAGMLIVSDHITAEMYGCVGNDSANNDTAFQNALDDANGTGLELRIGAGTFLVSDVEIKANTRIVGMGWEKTIIKQRSNTDYILNINGDNAGSADPTTNKMDIVIRDIQVLGTVAADGFSEQVHNLNIHAVSNLTIERCKIIGFRGDGIYLGSSNAGSTERHNENVTIRKCIFDGDGGDNRNAISIIDGQNVLIEDNDFIDCTRSNMPGAIDIEPNNNNFARVRNITIRNNRFDDIGGNVGVIAMAITPAQSSLTLPVFGIRVENNYMVNCAGPNIVMKHGTAASGSPVHSNGIVIRGNVLDGGTGIRLFDVVGVRVEDNDLYNQTGPSYVGFTTGERADHVRWVNNAWITHSGNALVIANTVDCIVQGNTFDDITTYPIQFHTGTSDGVQLINNYFGSAGSRVVRKEAGHTFTPENNRASGNIYDAADIWEFECYSEQSAINSYDETTAPADFPPGISMTITTSGSGLPGTVEQGTLVTHKGNAISTYRPYVWQFYATKHVNSPTEEDLWYRVASSTTTGWSSWQQLN